MVCGLWSTVLTSACGTPEPPPPPEPPSEAQLRDDIVGVRFAFFEDADGPRFWTITADEVRQFAVVDQAVDDSGRVARSQVGLTLRAEQRTIRGDLVLRHVRQDSAWSLADAGRAGPNWKAGDASATVYGVRVLSDSTVRLRVLALDPLVRYERGDYRDPLAPFRAEARALFDSTFASDSLREAAEDALARRAARAVVLQRGTVWALGRGEAPVASRIDSSDAQLVGCPYVLGFASPADRAAFGWAELATTSSVMGTPRAPGTRLSADLARALDRAARQHAEVSGADPDRLRQQDASAVDLDGDGRPEALGVFRTSNGSTVALAVSPGVPEPRVRFERQPDRGGGYTSLSLLGVVDVDADGAAEAMFLEEGETRYRTLVVSYRAGRFTDVFRGGGAGC